MKVQMWQIVVSEKESGQVHETITLPLAPAMAVMKGYENDDFYKVEASFEGYVSV
jgi:hypothetical protein